MAIALTTRALAGTLAALAGLAQGAWADDALRVMPAASGTQLMLYVSQPLGARVPLAPHFGLRIERMQAVSTVPGAPFSLQYRHRLLLDLQLRTGAVPRLVFGERYGLGLHPGLLALENADGSPLLR